LLRPNGAIDDGAERGAAIFLTILIWPFFFLSFLYYLLLASYSFRRIQNVKWAIVKGTIASCIIFSFVVCLFFYSSGIRNMAIAFIMTFLLSMLCAIPGSLLLISRAKSA
jgi:hypothetical protein